MILDWECTKPQDAVSRAEIEECDDVEHLCEWYETFGQRALEIKSFFEAFREAEIEDDPWYKKNAGALAYVKIGQKWIERRILELGGQPPYAPTDPRARHIRNLTEKVEKLQRQVEQLGRLAA